MHKSQQRKVALLMGVVFSVMGTIAFVLGPREWIRISLLKSHGIQTEGTLVDYLRSGSGSAIAYAPVFRYTTPDGKELEWTADVSSNNRPYATGAQVSLFFDPEHPENAILADAGYSLTHDFTIVVVMLFGLMGYSNLFWSGWQFYQQRKRNRSKKT